MQFARINLAQTNYHTRTNTIIFVDPPIEQLQAIYREYCRYKNFSSVMPIFDSQFLDNRNTVIGYYDDDGEELSAFSILREHDHKNVEAVQFAWNYRRPEQRLGIRSLEHECALYRICGFDYLYLGHADEYKSQFDGYEILGPI